MVGSNPRRTIASYVPPQAFAPGARAALVGLGYRVIAAATRGPFDDGSWQPDVRVIDERHLHRLPEENGANVPVVALCGRRQGLARDPRVVGVIERPAEVGALYPLLQEILEEKPRRAARAPTRIPARCTRADRRWTGEVLSLSEQGCLFRSRAQIEPGMELSLLFPLPLGRMVSTRARVMGRQGDAMGVAFTGASGPSRKAIADYVVRRLATLQHA